MRGQKGTVFIQGHYAFAITRIGRRKERDKFFRLLFVAFRLRISFLLYSSMILRRIDLPIKHITHYTYAVWKYVQPSYFHVFSFMSSLLRVMAETRTDHFLKSINTHIHANKLTFTYCFNLYVCMFVCVKRMGISSNKF